MENLPPAQSTQLSRCSVGCLPSTQAVHPSETETAPVVTENVPAVHETRQLEAPPAAEYVRAAQSVHVVSETAPFLVENVPVPQLKHALSESAASVSEYLPSPHNSHAWLPRELAYVPALQPMQFSFDIEAAVFEDLPTGHSVQSVWTPALSWYFPGGQ